MSIVDALKMQGKIAERRTRRLRCLASALCVVAAVQTGCRANSRDAATSGTQSGDSTVARAPRSSVTPPATPESPDTTASAAPTRAGAPDSARLVLRGRQLFDAKRCERCHTIGQGYKDGPDLAGVTERRSFKQINALLTDTEEAIQTDPDFQQLRIEHFKDMPNFNLSSADARALYYYLRAASLHVRP